MQATKLLVLTMTLGILLVSTTYAPNDSFGQYLVNGTDITNNNWPEVVYLQITKQLPTAAPPTAINMCTGTLLARDTITTAKGLGTQAEDVILTAAHCIRPDNQGRVTQRIEYTRGEGDTTFVAASGWADNPNYTGGVGEHDIALIFFNHQNDFTNGLPICEAQPNVGDMVTLVGFGCNDYTNLSPLTCQGSGVNSKRSGTNTIQTVGNTITFTGPIRNGDGTIQATGSGDSGSPYIVFQNGGDCIAAVNSGTTGVTDTNSNGAPDNGDTKNSTGANLHNNSSETFLTGALPGLDCDIYGDNCTTRLEALYQAVLGRAMDDSGQQGYTNALANGWSLRQVRNDIVQSAEASNALHALHQEVWGRPIDAAYLEYYTFLLATGGTLAEVRADMEDLRLQTVVLPVLIAVSLMQ
jgi:hypothetical protein